jgi:TetR/AcrR family transcriptional regulator, acrAB operon repressor
LQSSPAVPDPTLARRSKEDALQTRNALLDAAEAVFDSRGVAGASLQEVAEAAGLTRGAVYWHFHDKEDLFNAMMDRAILPFEQQWLVPSPDDAADPLTRLRDVLCDIVRQTATDSRLQRVLAISTQKLEYVGERNSLRERHLRVREQALQRIEGLLRLAAASGQLAAGVSPRAAARALHALVDGLIGNWMLDRDAFDLRRVGRTSVAQLIAGLTRVTPAMRNSQRRP